MLADHPSHYWLGLIRSGGIHHWSNPNESEVLYTNWMPGEPSGAPTNNCSLFYTTPASLGEWSEANCLTMAHFICETVPKRVPAHPDSHLHDTHFVQGRCVSGFYEYRSVCYTLTKLDDSVTRNASLLSDAVSTACSATVPSSNCSGQDANNSVGSILCPVVVAPMDQLHAAFLRSLIDKFGYPADSAWVGLKMDSEYVYADSPGLLDSTALLDHSIHSALSNRTVCITLNKDKRLLNVESCDSHLPALCGYFLDSHTAFPHNRDVNLGNLICKKGWHLHRSFCYRVELATPLSWIDAEIACMQEHGHLVSIGSVDEDNFVGSLLPRVLTDEPWIGLRISYDTGSSLMQWSDGTKVSYYRLHEEKIPPVESDECVHLSVVNGEKVWTPTADCKSPASFICKSPASSTNDTSDNMKGSSVCLSGSQPEFCFSLNKTAVKFRDAACETKGQYVATILDDSQQNFVGNSARNMFSMYLGRNPPQRYWIGLYRSQGTLQWVSGYPAVPNVYWKTGAMETDGLCVYLDIGLESMLNWGLANCEEEYPFLCSTVPPLPQPLLAHEVSPDDKRFCPLGFLYVHGRCYKVEGDKRTNYTFSEAVAKCRHSGGQLVTIPSMHEQDIITVLVAQRLIPFWIGLSTSSGGRKWVNGAPITYTNWLEGYPKWNNPGSPLCTYIFNEPTFVGKWAEKDCNEKKGFICWTEPVEVPAGQVATPHLFSQDDCLPGFQHYRDACYMVLQTQSNRSSSQLHDNLSSACATTVPAPLPCNKTRGLSGCPVVMTPHSQAEAAAMRLLARSKHENLSEVEVWTGIKIQKSSYRRVPYSEDGAPLGNVDIDFTQDRDSTKTDNVSYSCVSLRTDRSFLALSSCFQPAYSICVYYLDTHALHPLVANSNDFACPPTAHRVGRTCIVVLDPRRRTSWRLAELSCRNSGRKIFGNSSNVVGHLPSVHDIATIRFISTITLMKTIWLGLRATKIPTNDSRSWSDTMYKWTDGSPVDYMSFNSLNDSILSCAALDFNSTSWKMVNCYNRFSYGCQFPLESFPKPRPNNENEDRPVVKHCPEKFSVATEEACYAVVQSPLSQKVAYSSCSRLHPNANLASFHSAKEEKDFLALMSTKYKQDAYWIGLVQSHLQYQWTDSSVVNYVPKRGVIIESSHLWRIYDCFTLVLSNNASGSASKLNAMWYATDCYAQRPYICQIYHDDHAPNSMNSAHPAPPDISVRRCPPGYRQHEDRCFKFFSTVASFDNAEAICKQTVSGMGFIGSLARISNAREQDFVAGLFAAEAPSQPSMAWIGLRQGDGQRWNDGSKVTYARRGVDFLMPVTHNFDEEDNSLCTTMLYSSNVHFHGLWLRSSCALSDQIYFICQAVPSPVVLPTQFNFHNFDGFNKTSELGLVCPLNYSLAFFNRSALASGGKLPSPPHCLQLVTEELMTWEEARNLCQKHSATLPSIDSLADLNYLRSWMLTPRSLNGGGLAASASIWLDLRIPECPQCYSNWTWHAGDPIHESPVLITDWLNALTDPSGCYLFTPTPQSETPLHSPDTLEILSMRPEWSCTDVKLPVVCQMAAHLPSDSPTHGFASSLQIVEPGGICLKNPTPELSNIEAFRTNHSVAKSGRKCIRWDLVRHNFSHFNATLPCPWRIFTDEIAYSRHESPFWADNCAHLLIDQGNSGLRTGSRYRYACYTSADPELGLEDCEMQACEIENDSSPSLTSLLWIIFIALACLGLSVLLTICIVRAKDRQRFFVSRNNRWFSPPKVISSSSVFGGAISVERSRQQHSVLYSGGSDDPSVRVLGEEPALVATNPSLLHSLAPSLTFKQNVYRPLHDRDPLLLDEPDNADEFPGPV
ncbi:hypothetical protein Aperf_G00000053844 [Anoplocephala perfoliata]